MTRPMQRNYDWRCDREWYVDHIILRNNCLNTLSRLIIIAFQSRKLQEHGWKPRWFYRDGEDGPFLFAGGYWEAREKGNWSDCPNIFGEISENLVNSFDGC